MIPYPRSFDEGLDNLAAISRTRIVAWQEFHDYLVAPVLAEGFDLGRLSAALSTREIWLPLRGESLPSGETQEILDDLDVARARLRAALVASDVGVRAAADARGEGVTFKNFAAKTYFSVDDLRATGEHPHFARQALEAGVAACRAAGETEITSVWTEYEKAVDAIIAATLPASLHKAIALSREYEAGLHDVWPHVVRGHQKATAVFIGTRGYRYSAYVGWWLWRTVAEHLHPLRAAPGFDELISAEMRGPRSKDPVDRARELRPVLEREFDATVSILGERHPRVAAVLHRLGRASAVLEEPEARGLYERSLRLREELLGPDHLDVAATLLSLSSWYANEEKFELAEELGTRALGIFERHPGKGDSFVAAQLYNLGNLYMQFEKPERAEAVLLRLLELPRASGPDDRQLSDSLARLGELYEKLGRLDKAQAIHERAMRITQSK